MKQQFHSCFNILEQNVEEPLAIEDIYFYEQEVEIIEEPVDMEYYNEVEMVNKITIERQIEKYGDNNG